MSGIRSCVWVGAGAAAVAAFPWSAGAQPAMVPVPLTPASFNQDAVVELGAVNDPTTHFSNSVTASMDGGISKDGATWYQQGLNTAAPTTGLPGGVVVSTANPDRSYALQPFTGNNIRMLDSAAPTGTLTLVTPATYTYLSILTASGNGTGAVNVTVHFADAFPDASQTITSPDWFFVDPRAVTANGRVEPLTGNFTDVNGDNPRLYDELISLAFPGPGAHPVSSIDLAWTGAGPDTHTAIFAVSGAGVPEPATGTFAGLAAAVGLLVVRRRHVAGDRSS
ncbi:MAG TPA: hypothetical protein VH475_27450 [Tepidisphaeraceae bacterium]